MRIALEKVMNIKNSELREAFMVEQEHQLEHVATINDVAYINDSHSCSVEATWYALELIEKNKQIIWIAGGIDPDNDYSLIAKLVKRKVKVIILLEGNNRNMQFAFKNDVYVILTAANMEEAVKVAKSLTRPNEVVLFSPACLPFLTHKNLRSRGQDFRKIVKSIA